MSLPSVARPWAQAAAGRLSVPMLVAVDRALRRWGYRRTLDLLRRTSPAVPPHRTDRARARQLARLVEQAAVRQGWDNLCLRRVLVAWWCLRWLRVHADIRLGMSRSSDGSRGHAWLEVEGRPVNEQADVRDRYPLVLHGDLREMTDLTDVA